MRGVNGVQMQVHPKFQEICKDIQDDRVAKGKERARELTFKRLTLTLCKLLKGRQDIYDLLVNCDIDKNEI